MIVSPIPMMNVERQQVRLKADLMAALEKVLDSRAFIQGPFVQAFEQEFGAALGTQHVVGCSNGTSALALALEALGVGAGDEVITVASTFIATAEAVCHVGARPVFVDIGADSHTIDPVAVAAAITPRTKAIIAVHLYGNPCDMAAILDLARRHGLVVIEDTAQAHLASYDGQMAGTLGDAGTFSFFPGKNLGACGDAGAVTARDEAVADRLRRLRDHGRTSKYEHDMIGYNQRMDGMQAAVLSVKLAHLAEWTENRRARARQYDARLAAAGFRRPVVPAGAQSAYHLYPVEVSNRDETMRALSAAGIGTGIHYPLPLHLQPAFAHLGMARGALPVSERVAERVLSLPMCGELTEEEADRVCNAFLAVARP